MYAFLYFSSGMYALLIKPHSNVPACVWLSLKIYLGSVPDEDTEQLRPACLYTSCKSKRFSWGGRWVRGEVLYPTPEAVLGNGLGCLGFLQGFHVTLDCTLWAQTPIPILSALSKPSFCSSHPRFAETSASQRCGLLSLLTYLNMFNLYSSRQPRKQTIFSSQLINKAHDFTLWVWLRQGPKFNIIDIV